MNRIFKIALLASTMLVSTVICSFGQDYDGQRFSGKQGDMWFGGAFNFSSIGETGDTERVNFVMLTPQARFFPVSYLCIGPHLSWAGGFDDNSSINLYDLGGEVGFLYGAKKAMPYFFVSPYALLIHETYESRNYNYYTSSYTTEKETFNEQMFMLPFTLGLMVPFGHSGLGMQFQIGYELGFEDGDNMNTFSFGIGICGFGKKTAVSVLNINKLSNPYMFY